MVMLILRGCLNLLSGVDRINHDAIHFLWLMRCLGVEFDKLIQQVAAPVCPDLSLSIEHQILEVSDIERR